MLLLSKERLGWYCNKGKKRLPQLPEYPEDFLYWVQNTRDISAMSRRLNNLFAFSAIGTTEGFVYFDSLAIIVLTGRVYRCLLDLSEGEHSMRWFLYNKTAREQSGIEHGVLQDVIRRIRELLESVNLYIATI
jgi:hypothetical protein